MFLYVVKNWQYLQFVSKIDCFADVNFAEKE